MRVWHWIQGAFVISELVGVMAAAPVSLVSAWIIWARNDRSSWRDGWRRKVLFAGVITLSLSASLLVFTLVGEWRTQALESPMQKLLLDDLSATGAICCMLAMLASALGRGGARLAVAAGGLFALFVYGVVTPFGIVP